MDICIVTVYNNESCGSYWQAYALKNTIEKLGHKVFFYKIDKKGSAHSIPFHLVEGAKKLIKFKFDDISMGIKSYNGFCKAQKEFTVINKNSKQIENIDCYVIGSDTVWNLEKKKFHDKINIFFGLEFDEKKVITYAASAANTKKEKFSENSKIKNGIRKMADISVRDINTYEIVSDVFGIESKLVCDPTLLLDKEEYNALIKDNIKFENSPILIYYFGEFTNDTIVKIKELKSKTGKQIISLGKYRAWCDINLPFDPYLFIQCFRDCSFVLTNTYHGSIFSLIYQKQFADYGQEKKKIEYLLSSLKAEKAFADFGEDLIPFYDNRLDYSVINDEINKLKNSSEQFLKRNLIQINEK